MGKYLKFYEKCMKNKTVPGCNGLCQNFEDDKLFDIISPTREEICINNFGAYWAEDDKDFDYWGREHFGPTRQNIVLLMAAMNGEL